MKENNILIADFLGWVEQTDSNKRWFGSFTDKNFIIHKNNNKEPLLFHSDWNWLMLVVDKIESLETSNGNTFTIDFHRDSVLVFEYGKYTNEIVFTEGLGRMQNLYNACIAFVEWYNDNK